MIMSRAAEFACVVVILFLQLASSAPSNAAPMAGDGPGCKDKAVAATLAALKDTDPGYIEIWAHGMVDQSCRGYPAGAQVTVEERAEGMACVRASEDTACFWVRENMAPSPLTRSETK